MTEAIGTVGISMRVLYVIATAEEPMTCEEIGRVLGKTRDNISSVTTRLYRSELVVRRRRETDGKGPDPFEYRLAAPEEAFGDE